MKKHSSTKFVTDILFSAIPPFVNKFSSFIFLPLITKVLSGIAYSAWQQFSSSTTLLLRFSSLNVGTGLKKYLAEDLSREEVSRELSSVLAFVFLLSSSIGALLILFSNRVSILIFGGTEYQHLVVLLGIFLPIEVLLNEYSNFLRGRRLNKLLSAYNSLRHVTKLVGIGLSVFFIGAVEWIIGAFIIVESIWLSICIYKVHFDLKWPLVRPYFARVKKYIFFGLPLLFANMGIWLTTSSDRFLILHFLDLKSVGVYAAAYVLGSLPLLLIRPLTQVLLPDFALLASNQDFATIEQRLSTLVKYYLAGVTLFVLVNTLFADIFLLTLSTKDFSEGIIVVKITTVGIAIYGLMQLLNSVLSAIEKKSHFGFFWVIIGGVNIASNLLLIPRLGLLGAAISTLVTYSTGCSFFIYLVSRRASINISRPVIQIIASGGIILLLGWGLGKIMALNFILALIASATLAIAYLGLLYLFNFFTPREKKFITKLTSKFS